MKKANFTVEVTKKDGSVDFFSNCLGVRHDVLRDFLVVTYLDEYELDYNQSYPASDIQDVYCRFNPWF